MFIIATSVVAFFLHLGWEYAQCIPFFIHGEIPSGLKAMLFATFGDVVLTWMAYFSVRFFTHNSHWPLTKWRPRDWATLSVTAILLSVGIEILALERGRWSYTPLNPVIFGKVSLLPVLQLLLLFPLTFLLAKKIMTRLGSPFGHQRK